MESRDPDAVTQQMLGTLEMRPVTDNKPADIHTAIVASKRVPLAAKSYVVVGSPQRGFEHEFMPILDESQLAVHRGDSVAVLPIDAGASGAANNIARVAQHLLETLLQSILLACGG